MPVVTGNLGGGRGRQAVRALAAGVGGATFTSLDGLVQYFNVPDGPMHQLNNLGCT